MAGGALSAALSRALRIRPVDFGRTRRIYADMIVPQPASRAVP